MLEANETAAWKGPAAIAEGRKAVFAEHQGLLRAELGRLKDTPVLVVWDYRGGEKKKACLLRTGRLRGWTITPAYHDYREASLREAQPTGLMPFDPVVGFDARDCIRTKDTASTADGGLAILYGQLAPQG